MNTTKKVYGLNKVQHLVCSIIVGIGHAAFWVAVVLGIGLLLAIFSPMLVYCAAQDYLEGNP